MKQAIAVVVLISMIGALFACSSYNEAYRHDYNQYLKTTERLAQVNERQNSVWAAKARTHQVLTVDRDTGRTVYHGPMAPPPDPVVVAPPKKDPAWYMVFLNSPVIAGLMSSAVSVGMAYALRDDGDNNVQPQTTYEISTGGKDSPVLVDVANGAKNSNLGIGFAQSFVGLESTWTDEGAEQLAIGTDATVEGDKACLDCGIDTDTDTDTDTGTDTDTDQQL